MKSFLYIRYAHFIQDNILKITIIIYLSLMVTVSGYHITSAAASGVIEILKPVSNNSKTANQLQQNSGEKYIKRTGQVVFAAKDIFWEVELDKKSSAIAQRVFSESELVLAFFPEKEFRIQVDSESRPQNNILSIQGRPGESPLSTFTMTLTADNYLITFQDLDGGMVYKVVGDMKTGVGEVTQIDTEKIPPAYDLGPIVPPQQ